MPFKQPQVIGGVFALEDAPSGQPLPTPSIWAQWTAEATGIYSFRSARNALRHAVESSGVSRVWLPAYCCTEMVDALNGARFDMHFYPLSDRLVPDSNYLRSRLDRSDAVIGISYFGRPLDEAWQELAQDHADILWIEDCAQCLTPQQTRWAAVRVFSPRKLIGVPDGGILVDYSHRLPAPTLRIETEEALFAAQKLRRQDPTGTQNEVWYAAFKHAETLMGPSDIAMSRFTESCLRDIPLAPLARIRRDNYSRLHHALSEIALWDAYDVQWAPLGYPVKVKNAARLVARLTHERIFAPRHWERLPESEFVPGLAELSDGLVTLPCDQRYSPKNMDRIVQVVSESNR